MNVKTEPAPSARAGRSSPANTPSVAQKPAMSPEQLAQVRLLKAGVEGAESRAMTAQVQDLLVSQGLLAEGSFTPGKFERSTEQAVVKWQTKNKLQVDGVVGQQTWGSFYGLSLEPGASLLKGKGAPEGWSAAPAKARPQSGSAKGPAAPAESAESAAPAESAESAAPAESAESAESAAPAESVVSEATAATPQPAPADPAPTAPQKTPVASAPSATGSSAQAVAAQASQHAAPASAKPAGGPADGAKATRLLENGTPVLGVDGQPLMATEEEWNRAVQLPNGRGVLLGPGEQLMDNGEGKGKPLTNDKQQYVVFDANKKQVGLLAADGSRTVITVTDADLKEVAAQAKAWSLEKGLSGSALQGHLAWRNFKSARPSPKPGEPLVNKSQVASLLKPEPKVSRLTRVADKMSAFGDRVGINAALAKVRDPIVAIASRVATAVGNWTAVQTATSLGGKVMKAFLSRSASGVPYVGAVASAGFSALDIKHAAEVWSDPKTQGGQRALASLAATASSLATGAHFLDSIPLVGNIASSTVSLLMSGVAVAATVAETFMYPDALTEPNPA